MSEHKKTDNELTLEKLNEKDIEQFIKNNQEAFNYGATEEFGLKDDHFEEDGQIISRKTIINSIKEGDAYNVLLNGDIVGGFVIKVKENYGELELLFILPNAHNKGLGYSTWCAIEKLHPEVKVWETVTPYFEKRNIHFYVNRCGFQIIEFYNEYHKDPNNKEPSEEMFKFRKKIR